MMGKLLAIDYGAKRIGTAISDPDGTWAFPREVLDGGEIERTIATIASLVHEEGVSRIIVGRPLKQDGTSGAAVKDVEVFVSDLNKRVDVPVEYLDERFTSKQAETLLRDAPKDVRARNGATDTLAAVLILRSYLEQKGTGG